jgi:imidazolonepropionase-like amidohydrolase
MGKIQISMRLPAPVLITLLLLHSLSYSQTRPAEGLRQNTPNVHALTNARIVVAPGRALEKAALVVRNNVIEAVGASITPPADAKVWDLHGQTIYPGLIEMYSSYGMPQPARPAQSPGGPPAPASEEKNKGAAHWNSSAHPEKLAIDEFAYNKDAAEKLRGLGFTVAVSAPMQGIFRGNSAVVLLGEGETNDLVLNDHFAQHLSFNRGGGDGYPNSLMGSIALIRQTFLDAKWYAGAQANYAKSPAGQKRPEMNESLAALALAGSAKQVVIFEIEDELNALRAAKIAKEFGLQMILRGSGREYRRLEAIKATGLPIILPMNFPDAPNVATPEDEVDVSLDELKHWDTAPENPARLQKSGLSFALTTATLKDAGDFAAKVRTSMQRGLTFDAALASLTTTPAKLLGMEHRLGTLEAGKLANFVIADGELFAEKTKIRETWIDGKRYEIKPAPEVEPRGTWDFSMTIGAAAESGKLEISGEAESPSGKVTLKGKTTSTTTTALSGRRLTLTFSGDSLGYKDLIRMSGVIEEASLAGSGQLGDGRSFTWTATRTAPFTAQPDTTKPPEIKMASFETVFPDGAFGRKSAPEQPAAVLVRNATIWTNGSAGKIENADLLVQRGKVMQVGKSLAAPAGAAVIDATGKHVTSGVIDAHSHIAITQGVNEGTQAITAEVRIGDVLDSDNISIYRQLAGGVTMSNLLHGSANPIGGQNAVIKLRWGALPEEMKCDGAMPGIKFALGENVKQSNWGERFTTRYPQTRMGVEQIFRDEFQAAKDYDRAWKEFTDKKKIKGNEFLIPPRRDLELETIVEILQDKRQIHCHSYRQDEILATMRVAEELGFHIDVFQHILEGYKVAEVMAKHKAAGSSFTDWWAYKFEVYDAIPFNGALMHNQGIIVSFNSDDAELARRLNTEAGKAVKYGNVPEEEAWKFVTLNPAKQLRIDNRAGSLEPGKDADFVIWSGHPMSTLTRCEQTWIDGRKYFDIQEDSKLREEVAKQRATLVQKALASKDKKGKEESKPATRRPRAYRCEDVEDEVQ